MKDLQVKADVSVNQKGELQSRKYFVK